MNLPLERVPRLTLLLGLMGVPVAAWLGGWASAAGWMAGAAASAWNFLHLQRAVGSLAEAAASSNAATAPRMAFGLLVRFLIMATLAVVILRISKQGAIAFVAGLLASFAALCVLLCLEPLWKKSG